MQLNSNNHKITYNEREKRELMIIIMVGLANSLGLKKHVLYKEAKN